MRKTGGKAVERARRIIWAVGGLIIALLIGRFFVSVFKIALESGATEFFCSLTDPILLPVLVLFGQQPPHEPRMIEFSALISVAFYLVIADSLSKLTILLASRSGLMQAKN